jgi:AcrR family transcriptional regulator
MDAPQRRIIDAALRCLTHHGPADVSLSDIAREAGVSKALIHYHFRDRDMLIVGVIDHVAVGLAARERHALGEERSALAVDALWQWLEAELERGEIRVLLSLADHPNAAVREAAQRAAAGRRQSTTSTVERLFETLELRPRVPAPLIADVAVAWIDGLALDARDTARPARIAFDVFWLAMLSLAE